MSELFQFHKLNGIGMVKAESIAKDFGKLLGSLKVTLGDQESREFSIAKTKLEEACFFTKKAMAIQKENQSEGV